MPRRPTPHWSISAWASAVGLVRRDLVAAGVLRVEDDLGLGLGLDRVDDPLGRLLGVGADDAGVVVDGLSVDGVGVRRARPAGPRTLVALHASCGAVRSHDMMVWIVST